MYTFLFHTHLVYTELLKRFIHRECRPNCRSDFEQALHIHYAFQNEKNEKRQRQQRRR